MLSIIICSRTQSISKDLYENIKKTVGCHYELIVIDNSENQYSIFEAYNLGIEQSKGDYLCFMHDDILIHTQDWGIIVNMIFSERMNIGLLGIAGSKVKTRMPSGWWNCPNDFKEINIIQHISKKQIEKWEYGFKGASISEVVAIDGVFMVMRKKCNLFFDTTLKGFHNYDLNISFECKKRGFKIVVTNEILIEHFSNGKINASWYNSAIKVHMIYSENLPLSTIDIDKMKSIEFKNGFNFLKHYLTFGLQIEVFKLWLKLFLLEPFSKIHFEIFKLSIKSLVYGKKNLKTNNT
jgi:hypothetical protein